MAPCLPDREPGPRSPHCTPGLASQPQEVRLLGTGSLQGAGFWNECGKGGLGAGDPACPWSHNPLSPSTLRVPGLTPETPFGLPVFPAGGSQAYILSLSPHPHPVLAHRLPLPAGSRPSGCQRGQSWRALRCCWGQGFGPGRRGEGAGRMCLPLAVPGGASRAAGAG